MKQLELNLQKRLLIVEFEDREHFNNVSSLKDLAMEWENGEPIKIICKGSELTAEIYSNKYGYSEVEALDVANCAFARVWKYPTFDKNKSKAKDVDKGIKIWLHKIVFNELMKFGVKETCAEVDENDLDIIENIDELVTFTVGDEIEKKRDLKLRLEILERAMLGLSEKQKIIYLTYKAYENNGKNIPRIVSQKLKERLNIAQSSIRVYKKEAIEHINNYLKSLNGN